MNTYHKGKHSQSGFYSYPKRGSTATPKRAAQLTEVSPLARHSDRPDEPDKRDKP